MSQHVQHLPSVRVGLPRRSVAWIVALVVLIGAVTATVLVATGGSDHTSRSVQPVSNSIGGPNETLRGQAAAGAAGAFQPTGGPNETLRGQAVAGASK
jgi:hypothetical protein